MKSDANTKVVVGLTAFLAGVLAVSMLAAGIDYPGVQYVGSGVVSVDQTTRVITATLPTDFSGTNCTNCTMTGPTTTFVGATTLNGSPVATDASVATAIGAIAFPVTSVNGSTGAVTGLETTAHAASTYSTPASVAATLASYSTTTQMNTTIAAAQPQKAHLTTATDGTVTWTYPVACSVGANPYVQALSRATAGSTDVINVQMDGAPTNTAAKFRITRTAVTVVSLLGLTILSVPTSPGAIPIDAQVFCA